MNHHALSRSESRKERKLVLLLLLVVIGVGLGCFALGVMVGRGGAPQAVVSQEVAPAPVRIPVAAAAPAGTPPATAGQTPAPADAPADSPANLTFYDNLPRGEQPPLGSGINLPPAAPPPPAAAPASPAPASAPVPAPKPVVAVPTAPEPAATAGSYLVQVASFSRPDDAGVLQARLAKKGLQAYVQQADLAGKGVWYRVYVGPLASAAAAEQVAARLKTEEKLSPLVRKR